MIVTKNLDCFKTFISDAEEAKVPFHLLGYLNDEAPTMTFDGADSQPPRKFLGRLLLCSSIATVMLMAESPIEEKPVFDEFLKTHKVRRMERLTLDNKGVVVCE
ncbi:MAG: hypothetical protein ACTTKW_03955 [Schwartzia sp. (in: firmicutes)]